MHVFWRSVKMFQSMIIYFVIFVWFILTRPWTPVVDVPAQTMTEPLPCFTHGCSVDTQCWTRLTYTTLWRWTETKISHLDWSHNQTCCLLFSGQLLCSLVFSPLAPQTLVTWFLTIYFYLCNALANFPVVCCLLFAKAGWHYLGLQ